MSQNQNAAAAVKRIAVPLLEAEIDAIDAWGFSRHIRNRSDAMKALIEAGLKATTGETP